METATQIRSCHVGACSERVPERLDRQGVCLSHYLDEAFTRVDAALRRCCDQGQTPDAQTTFWLKAQGDLAVQLLAAAGSGVTASQRTKLLELLLCLAKVHECMQQAGAGKS